MARVELILYSEAEQRVPRGAWQDLILALVRKWLDDEATDISPFVPGLPPGSLVSGPRPVLEALIRTLETQCIPQKKTQP